MKLVSKTKVAVLTEAEMTDKKSNMLIESFDRCPDAATFLRENKNLPNADQIFHQLALTESVINKDKSFLFENGMSIPAIGNKMKSKATLNGIFEMVQNESEFVQLVESNIVRILDFSLTESDKSGLISHYNSKKQLN